jgi:MYXO-CTERM domain-containing protein
MKSFLSIVPAFALLLFASASSAESGVVLADQARIREHLSSVEAYLRRQDTSRLTAAQREARAKNIAHLHEYWTAGVFPRNTLRTYPTPIFIDPAGRACAVGYLMIESGWEEAARKVARQENLAYVNDIQTPEVAQWLAQSGLSAQEAAWIQPSYDPEFCWSQCPCDEEPVCAADGITYLNPCHAERCGAQDSYVPGCCTGDQDMPRLELAIVCRCYSSPEPPEECLDESYANGADLCVGFIDPPPLPDTSSGCSAANASTQGICSTLPLLALVLLATRRRRRSR